ncbi:MAG: hypothetical protein HYW02_01460 [Deltaproteobacteria bacterium]|nr:hypothetical protein [Deltaproteobacteria bacterium]MBI2500146.1 hypothetical protein [Deltaproteobacteria bacterium]
MHRILLGLFLMFTLYQPSLRAAELTPQWWSFEFKGSLFLPKGQLLKDFLNCCYPSGSMEFGLLIGSKLGVEVGGGFMTAKANSVGRTSGQVAAEEFRLTLIPLYNSVTFRADFKEDQILVPYVKVGPDYVFYRENVQGTTTKVVKYGLHFTGGLQFLLEVVDEISHSFEADVGVNDIYLTLEGRYNWIDSFGSGGLDLSHWSASAGFLFEF